MLPKSMYRGAARLTVWIGLLLVFAITLVALNPVMTDKSAEPLTGAITDARTPSAAQTLETSIPAPLYAFAKASPLIVFDNAELSNNGRKANFEFGKAYEAKEETGEAVRLKLAEGKSVFVRSAHVTTVRIRQWLQTTTGYNSSERAKIRFWESLVKLNQFLSGINTQGALWDFEEYFDAAPDYSLSLPIIGTDTLELLGGTRQLKIASVMVPLSSEMYQKFEASTSEAKRIDMHLLVDVSGSARGFLEPAMAGMLKSLKRNEQIEKRIRLVTITTFGESKSRRSTFLGRSSLAAVEAIRWFREAEDQISSGEREPLIDALYTMQANVKLDDTTVPVLIILSGADVELSSYSKDKGKELSIEDWDPKYPTGSIAIFVQTTPEPGEELRGASRRLRGISNVRYLEYSATAGDTVAAELSNVLEAAKTEPVSTKAFADFARLARIKHMMALLPRVLTAGSRLPSRQSYETQAEWHTVRLWLALDQLLWKQTMQ